MFSLTWVLVICVGIPGSSAIYSKFMTQVCPGTVGPTYGDVILWDYKQWNGNVTQSWYVPPKDFDCWMVVRGQNRLSKATYKLELKFRGTFSVRGYDYGSQGRFPYTGGDVNGTDCETAYMEIYNATDAGMPDAVPTYGPMCGTIGPAVFSSFSQSMVIHIFVAAVPEYLLSTTPSTTLSTTASPTADPSITIDPNATTILPSTTLATTTRAPTPLERCMVIGKCPYIKFTGDFTSYIENGCYEDGQLNDDEQMNCLNTNRCIHQVLLCDGQYSNNCGDNSDQIGSACYRPTRPPPIPIPYIDRTPLYVAIGAAVGSLLFLYYCCWRPGWIPWRLARFRNTHFGKITPCCRTCCRESACGGAGCFKPTVGKWRAFTTKFHTQTESQFPDIPHNPDRYRKGALMDRLLGKACCMKGSNSDTGYDAQGNKLQLTGGPWLNFACDDGMHIREIR